MLGIFAALNLLLNHVLLHLISFGTGEVTSLINIKKMATHGGPLGMPLYDESDKTDAAEGDIRAAANNNFDSDSGLHHTLLKHLSSCTSYDPGPRVCAVTINPSESIE